MDTYITDTNVLTPLNYFYSEYVKCFRCGDKATIPIDKPMLLDILDIPAYFGSIKKLPKVKSDYIILKLISPR